MEEQTTSGAENKNNNTAMIASSIILAGAIIAGAVIYTGGENKGKSANIAETAPRFKNEELKAGGAVLGNPEASVTIVEFSDFQCPFCGRFFNTAEQQILENYVKTGKVKFIYRHFAFLGPESELVASASECAAEQGKFWEYHDYLFKNQGPENDGYYTKERLKDFALKVGGLNTGQFGSCLDAGKYSAKVAKDTNDGRRFGVTGTPTNFVNGKKVVGSIPFEDYEAEGEVKPGFKTIIEEELKKIK